MTQHVGELHPPVRLMLTPGPSSIDPRVYRAMATPLVGHMDPWFQGLHGKKTQILMRQIFSDRKPHHHAAFRVGLRRD